MRAINDAQQRLTRTIVYYSVTSVVIGVIVFHRVLWNKKIVVHVIEIGRLKKEDQNALENLNMFFFFFKYFFLV
ncbi:hypothetical protein MTR67_029518 [Solanum verrucosum]|uniref:Uncharacterized protein n=1 Tax=Solanum verrucosum TaxID=315347 RepID=A0AAF0R7M4_SOLVR|nr:hypothetical protein MTR67_029518 [Solanum verrucosum]